MDDLSCLSFHKPSGLSHYYPTCWSKLIAFMSGGVSGWSTGSGHVTACSKHVAPGGPQTWFRMQHSTHAQNQWRALCFSYHFDARLKTQHIFQQDFFNKLFYMQTNCLFRQEFDFTMMVFFFCSLWVALSIWFTVSEPSWLMTVMTIKTYIHQCVSVSLQKPSVIQYFLWPLLLHPSSFGTWM